MWNFFENIFCINLFERKDRYDSSLKIFKDYDIPVTYYQTNRNKNGDRGCFESHVEICKKCINFSRIIIFEDDIFITLKKEKFYKAMKRIIFFLSRKNWEIFYLGCFPDNRKNTVFSGEKNIYLTTGYGAHAYILNNSAIRRIASLKWEGKSYDSYLMEKAHHAYFPRIFCQRAIDSDISRGINIINKFPGLKRFGLDFNEFYATNLGISLNFILFYSVFFVLFFILIFLRLK